MANTRETMGEQACLDALVADTLTSFEDDGVTSIGNNGLYWHNALTSVTLSQCKAVNQYGLACCSNLETVDIDGSGNIATGAFRSDGKLAHLVMRNNDKSTLQSTDALRDTPIQRFNGAIYVSDEALAEYKSTSWYNYFITTLDEYPTTTYENIEDDWETIISKAEDGTAADSYSIGDTKMIDLGSEGKIYARIAAFNADVLASDTTKTAGITFVAANILTTKHTMNPANDSGTQGTGGNGGWEYSSMRSYLTNTILPKFPSTIQASIKEVNKYSDYIVPGETTVTHDQMTVDKLWIPSTHEVVGGTYYERSGPTYTTVFGSRVKSDQSGKAASWWLRTAYGVKGFRSYDSDGTADASWSSTQLLGVVLGFCI